MPSCDDKTLPLQVASGGIVSDGEEVELMIEGMPTTATAEQSQPKRMITAGRAAAFSLLLAAAGALAVICMNTAQAKRDSVPAKELSTNVEGLYSLNSCPTCTGGTCQCDWALSPGVCDTYDHTQSWGDCCWSCCCHRDDTGFDTGFDCSAGYGSYGNYMNGWSWEKKQYCCDREGVGCAHHPMLEEILSNPFVVLLIIGTVVGCCCYAYYRRLYGETESRKYMELSPEKDDRSCVGGCGGRVC